MAFKTTFNKTKGLYHDNSPSDSVAGFAFENGGYSESNLFVGTTTLTLSVTQSTVAVTASVNVRLALPSAPVDGQLYVISKAQSAVMTVSLTGTSTAHTINGLATPVDLLTAAGSKTVRFVGTPMNMWITG